MADMMDTLKGLLGDDAEDKISGIMKILNPDGDSSPPPQNIPTPDAEEAPKESDTPGITPEMLMAAQSLIGKLSSNNEDDRTRLLMSLKPYMSQSRKSSIDSAVKMLNLAHFSEFFKGVI